MTGAEVINKARGLGLPFGQYVVVGGGSLAARGMRETADVDIVVTPELFKRLIAEGWPLDVEYQGRWNRRRLKRDGVEFHEDMLLTRQNKFIDTKSIIRSADTIEGVPFQDLKSLLLFKEDAERPKDAHDVVLIKKELSKHI